MCFCMYCLFICVCIYLCSCLCSYLFICLCVYLFSCVFIYSFVYVLTYLYIPPIYLILFLLHINPIVPHWLPHESVGSSEGATWNSWQLCGGFYFPDFLLIFLSCKHYYLFMQLLCWPLVADAAGLDSFLSYLDFTFVFLIILNILKLFFSFWL